MAARGSRTKQFWPVAVGTSAASVASATTTKFSNANIAIGDVPIITPQNAAAAALEGGATGVYAAKCTVAGEITITHASAAGGELWNVAVFPQNLVP